jgi:methylmalonyl-CoA mutase N-terminal domain/subunit
VRLALRTQQVIAYESGVADSADPLGGSYMIENLTNQLEERARAYIKKIDELGGMLRAIETGFVQHEIQEAAFAFQKAVEKQETVVVGVNRFRSDEEEVIPVLHIDEKIERDQVERVRALRDRRDKKAVERSLLNLKEAAVGNENLLPRILACVEAYATVGEISDVMRKTWGEYREAVVV